MAKTEHIFITEGRTLQGESFEFYTHGQELQLYWDDGEMSVKELQPWEDPKLEAELWSKEIMAAVHLN
ncbi:hypothetical protein HYO99_gp11 [Roseobacter phage RD-1410W1-01]|uniref:Uncharacterized protein n=1 Tax=Roseobacter phage RD-1410W1-01 TaxID=1815984 RepID=A0A191VYG0_9CAUD|nr:hypothetical protein HYO99_gp11 [Roseobacter phage RD-1410W1-01]ANJ20745.1 hypothetical protein RDp01_gp11 [Roseobacter phage RD-1410W1-01]